MSPSELQEFLHRSVPLSKAMSVCVEAVSPERLVLTAPMEPNINQHGTIFGGSSATLALLSAWSLLHTRLVSEPIACKLVVQRTAMEYNAPMSGIFAASASLAPSANWKHFVHAIQVKGKARIQVVATLQASAEVAGHLEGEFVAIREHTGASQVSRAK